MLNIKCDINQQDLKRVDPHFVKSEEFALTWVKIHVGENSD